MNDVLAMILAGGQGDRLSILSEQRAKPAVIFGGQYRIIDFALSNCANSQISEVAVLTQYRPRSLVNHIGAGRPWGLDTLDARVQILQPYLGREDMDWYHGTADAVYQNLYMVEESRAREILILAGDHVYSTSYRNMIAYHRTQAADVTVAVYSVPREEAHRYGVLDLDEAGRVMDWEEKPANPRSPWISMGIYVFNKDVLVEALQADAEDPSSRRDFGHDIIPAIYRTHRVFGYQYQEYWRDVGTVQSYWDANMDLTQPYPELELNAPERKIRTSRLTAPPARFGSESRVHSALVSAGARIDGTVERSVVSPFAIVEEGAVVRDSIIHHGTVIGRGARVDRAILDKEVVVGPGAWIGYGDGDTPNEERPDIVNTGITIVGKRVRVPGGLRIGRNVIIGPGVDEELRGLGELAAGATVMPTQMPLHLFV
ncbi:MAG: sugar phosphate nucleotidyltransferase [Dehalococcoidia bacterium]